MPLMPAAVLASHKLVLRWWPVPTNSDRICQISEQWQRTIGVIPTVFTSDIFPTTVLHFCLLAWFVWGESPFDKLSLRESLDAAAQRRRPAGVIPPHRAQSSIQHGPAGFQTQGLPQARTNTRRARSVDLSPLGQVLT